MTTTYTGTCPKCDTEHRRVWQSPWRGFDGETHYAADCGECGPGHELTMFPDEPEDEGEIVEVFSLDPSWNGQTMVVERVEEDRQNATLNAITRRQVFAAAREMATTKWQREPNWVFAETLYGLGSTYAYAMCREMGIDPEAKTATRWPVASSGRFVS